MTSLPATFPRLSTDWQELFDLDEAKLDASLRSLLRACEAGPGLVDFDRLMGFGVGLARAGRERLDEVAIDWLAENPVVRRLGIVAAFLGGLWQRAARARPVQTLLVE